MSHILYQNFDWIHQTSPLPLYCIIIKWFIKCKHTFTATKMRVNYVVQMKTTTMYTWGYEHTYIILYQYTNDRTQTFPLAKSCVMVIIVCHHYGYATTNAIMHYIQLANYRHQDHWGDEINENTVKYVHTFIYTKLWMQYGVKLQWWYVFYN